MWEEQLQSAIEAAKLAAKEILSVYNTDFEVEIKDDKSPVTIADKKSDKVIRDFLLSRYPKYAFLTEEGKDDLSRIDKEFVWIIDSLDGTELFVKHIDTFAINIALCNFHEIVVGLVYLPCTGEYYYATKNGGSFYFDGETLKKIRVSNKVNNLTCILSVLHADEKEKEIIKKQCNQITNINYFSASPKHCYIARGLADITYKFTSNSKEWDIAPCDIIVKEAGGVFIDSTGKEFIYNKENVNNTNGYISANKRENILL